MQADMVVFSSLCLREVSRNLNVDDGKDFHTSAVYAAALNCITLPFRLRELSVRPLAVSNLTEYGGIDMASLVHLLMGQRRRRVSILDVSMPAQPLTGIFFSFFRNRRFCMLILPCRFTRNSWFCFS
jgi:hypothetical protein